HDPGTEFPVLGEQGGRHGAVDEPHAPSLGGPELGVLEGLAPDAEGEAVLVVVREHQLRPVVAERRAHELVVRVADLSPRRFDVERPVPSFSALDVMGDAVVDSVGRADHGIREFFRGHLRAWIGRGGLPVVGARAARAARDRRRFLHHDDPRPPIGRAGAGHAPSGAAADHEDIAVQPLGLVEFDRIGPEDAGSHYAATSAAAARAGGAVAKLTTTSTTAETANAIRSARSILNRPCRGPGTPTTNATIPIAP